MDDAVVKFSKFAGVPAVSRTYEIPGDPLEGVDVVTVAVRALVEVFLRILEAAVHTAVAVVVHRAVAHVVLVHKVDDLHNRLRVVGRIAVDFHIEDVAGVFVLVVRAFDLRLVLGGALVVDGDVAGVGVVILVRDSGKDSEDFLVPLGEASGQAFGGSCKEGEVVLIGLSEAVDLLSHMGYDAKSELLGLFAFAVMLADEGDKAFGEADEADGEGSLVHHGFDRIVVVELLTAKPQAVHQQGELLLERGLLEVEALVELLCGNLQRPVELLEELLQAEGLVGLLVHSLDCKLDDVDRGEGEVAAADGSLGAELVAVNAGTAAHSRDLVDITLGVVLLPGVILVEGCVEVQEVREEPACGHLAGILVEVVVLVAGEVADSSFLLPYLDREDCGGAVAHSFVCRVEDFADDAASLRGGVRSIVDRGEDDLVSAAGMDGVHIVDKRLHCLMDTADGLVDGVLLGTLGALEADKVVLEVVVDLGTLEVGVVHVLERADLVDLFLIGLADVGGEIEVECGDCLTSVHFVLDRFHRDAGKDACGLDPLRGTGFAVAGLESVLEDKVQRVLDAGKGLCGVVVLVVDVDVILCDSFADVVGEEALVHIALGCLGGELHHHSGGSVRVHIRILTGDVVHLRVDDGLENVVGLSLTGHGPLVAVADILLRNLLAGAFHKFRLHAVLDFFHGHFITVHLGDGVCDLRSQYDVFSFFRHVHCFQDGGNNLLIVEFYASSVTFKYTFYHIRRVLRVAPVFRRLPRFLCCLQLSFSLEKVCSPRNKGNVIDNILERFFEKKFSTRSEFCC
mgnify:CR=1 FL=1